MGNYTHLTVYTDGASRGNPGLAAAGIHIGVTIIFGGKPTLRIEETEQTPNSLL